MQVRFNCPECGYAIRLSGKNSGKRGRCPECSASVTAPQVPSFAKPASATQAASEETTKPGGGNHERTGRDRKQDADSSASAKLIALLVPDQVLFRVLGRVLTGWLAVESSQLDEEDHEWAEKIDQNTAYYVAGIGGLIGLPIFLLAGAAIGVIFGAALGRGLGFVWSLLFLQVRRFLSRPRRWVPSVLANGDASRAAAALIPLTPLFGFIAWMVITMK